MGCNEFPSGHSEDISERHCYMIRCPAPASIGEKTFKPDVLLSEVDDLVAKHFGIPKEHASSEAETDAIGFRKTGRTLVAAIRANEGSIRVP